MKNLFYSLCLLIGFSSIAQSIDYQITEPYFNNNLVVTATKSISEILINVEEIAIEEEDEAFDFDIQQFLPNNFNAFAGLFDAFDAANVEEDEAFDFDTAAYLPIGFNANIVIEDEAEYTLANVEEDEAFDFDTTAYLPLGFNSNGLNYDTLFEIAIEEADEPFEFDYLTYLPEDFDAYSRLALSTSYYLTCIALPSL
jgi:hypothetical protein